jgi:hypothetical protein
MMMQRLIAVARRSAPFIMRDGAAFAGVLLVSYGVWQVYAPAGYITVGLILIGASALHARMAA